MNPNDKRWHVVVDDCACATCEAMFVGTGVVLRTRYAFNANNSLSVSTCFIPGAFLEEDKDNEGHVMISSFDNVMGI